MELRGRRSKSGWEETPIAVCFGVPSHALRKEGSVTRALHGAGTDPRRLRARCGRTQSREWAACSSPPTGRSSAAAPITGPGPHMPRSSLWPTPASAARGATAYVTLEPCNHHGLTPPCTQALIARGCRGGPLRRGRSDHRPPAAPRPCASAGIDVDHGPLTERGQRLPGTVAVRGDHRPALRHVQGRQHPRRLHRRRRRHQSLGHRAAGARAGSTSCGRRSTRSRWGPAPIAPTTRN